MSDRHQMRESSRKRKLYYLIVNDDQEGCMCVYSLLVRKNNKEYKEERITRKEKQRSVKDTILERTENKETKTKGKTTLYIYISRRDKMDKDVI